jgi:peptidoglycan/xylan/chitin deacetylase (PgdA/CDA1 family)
MGLNRRAFLGAASAAVVGACTGSRRAARPTAPADGTGAVGAAGGKGGSAPTDGSAPSGPAVFVAHGPTGSKQVAFTFHGSGDPALLHELLAAAGRLGVPVTVFAVGSWLDQHPEVAGAIQGGGHELANHTYTHPALGQASAAAVADEIVRCRDALTRHAGSPGAWFRPSGLAVPSALILAEAGRAGYRTVVGYDVDPLDYQDPPAATIAERVDAGLHSGAVVSLHTGHANTVTAFEPMVAAARRHQLAPVRLRDLLPPPA